MKLQPRTTRVLIQPDAPATQTASGLLLAEHRKPEQLGHVLAIGSEVRELAVGDHVLFSWQSGQELHLDDEGVRLIVMLEQDVLAIAFNMAFIIHPSGNRQTAQCL